MNLAKPQRSAFSDLLTSEGGQAVLKAGAQVLIAEAGSKVYKNTGVAGGGGGTGNQGGYYSGSSGGSIPVNPLVWIVGGFLLVGGLLYAFFKK